MASQTEPTTFGATIIPPSPDENETRGQPSEVADRKLSSSPEPPSRASTPPSCLRTKGSGITESSIPAEKNPSPYAAAGELEAGLQPMSQAPTQHSQTRLYRTSGDGPVKDCTVWPSKQSLKEKAKAAKHKRQCCGWFFALPKRQRIAIKLLIALLVIAAATGIGVGISRAVGGGVWTSDDSNSDIPN